MGSLRSQVIKTSSFFKKTKLFKKMPWSAPPPAPKCPTCQQSVFAKEAYMAADRTPFHTKCIKCIVCQKRLTPASINEHDHKLYCPVCYGVIFNQKDDIPERMVMQGLPIQGMFIVDPIKKDEFLSPEELKKREEAETAARAWQEATLKIDSTSSCIKIRETCEIAPDDTYSL